MKKILALALSLLLLTGCAKEPAPYIPTGDALVSDEPTAPTNRPATSQSAGLGYNADHSLNPYDCTNQTNRVLMGLVYQGLFTVDRDYQTHPVLCREYSVSRDMKTYTFRLAQATFSDGSVLTVADAAASIRRALDSKYYGGRLPFVESVQTQEEDLVITLTTPCENLPILLDIPIVKADQIRQARPMGTGPYYYQELESGLELLRRNDWWCSASFPVTAQKISLHHGATPSQLRDLFEFQDLSLVCADPGADSYVDFHSDYELWDNENGIFLYLGCNAESYILSQGNIRAALTYAIDRGSIVTNYYRDFAQAATLPASPQSPYYSKTLAQTVTFDPQRLTDAISQIYLEPHELIFLVNSDDSVRVRIARSIAATLTQCGLTVTVTALPTADYVKALEERTFDLYLGQTRLCANMDLSAFFTPEGSLSYGDISDPILATLCAEALANRGNYYTLHQKVLENGNLIPISFRSNAIFAQRGSFTDFSPARDNIFYYDLGTTAKDILVP